MLFEVLNAEQAVLARTKVAKAADGVYEIAFSANEKHASCNGAAAEGDLKSAAFRFLNAKLSVGLAGGAGTYITVTALGGEDLKYYIAVPNYEREYGEGETIVDDFQLDGMDEPRASASRRPKNPWISPSAAPKRVCGTRFRCRTPPARSIITLRKVI